MEFEFSVDTMKGFTGKEDNCKEYTQFFCKKAIAAAEDAAMTLSKLANLQIFSSDLRAEAESARARIKGIYGTFQDLESFFKQVPELKAAFADAQKTVDTIDSKVIDHHRTIVHWINMAQKL